MNQNTNDITTKYYIDDDGQIYILSHLKDGDKVKKFLEDNCHMVTREEIENDIYELIESFESEEYRKPRMTIYDEIFYDYQDTQSYLDLNELLSQLDEAIIITPGDEIYNTFQEEMRELYAV